MSHAGDNNSITLADVMAGIDELRQATREQGERISGGIEVLTEQVGKLTKGLTELRLGFTEIKEDFREVKEDFREIKETAIRQEKNIFQLVTVVERQSQMLDALLQKR